MGSGDWAASVDMGSEDMAGMGSEDMAGMGLDMVATADMVLVDSASVRTTAKNEVAYL